MHDLEDQDLVILERLSIAIDKEPKKVEKFRLVEASLRLSVDRVADLFYELAHIDLIKK